MLQQLEGKPQICHRDWSIFSTVPSLSALRWLLLTISPSCRSCQHCSGGGTAEGWCRLRRLAVHADVSDLVVCHHWTPRSPQLPMIRREQLPEMDQQLELDRALA
ncbi:hypothetical [Parasynechococcus marenigrum WH 8102]|uniref:Uncharacterized protein n=1 Tax=Parasynechococcus marenigrum (strain WH8102) TaxID=84588 RepID=Q7U3K7_PARMW|nr:hypothetical [Parasynechococcus marenigrum WH 8102]